METVDDEFLKATLDFIDRVNQEKKPFFAWFNPSRMHIWTRLKPESQGKTGLGIYPDGMVEHDGQAGQLLKKLDDLGIAANTCHTAEFDAWRGSHNASAMQPASAATVLGDFAGAQFEHFGVTTTSFVTATSS
jgi:arylsulfatase A-like enzyme